MRSCFFYGPHRLFIGFSGRYIFAWCRRVLLNQMCFYPAVVFSCCLKTSFQISLYCFVADLTPAEQQLLVEIRRRKTELLQEIQVMTRLFSHWSHEKLLEYVCSESNVSCFFPFASRFPSAAIRVEFKRGVLRAALLAWAES